MKVKFSVFPRNQSPGFVIYRAASKLKLGLQREFTANGFHITPEQWGVMSALWENDGIHQSLLAENSSKDRHNLTRILNRLEKDKLIRREHDLEDLRLQKIYLTEDGKALKERLIPIVTNFLEQAIDGLDQEDLDSMKRILSILIENIEKISTKSRSVKISNRKI